jgi:hypothetical protein
MNAREQQMMEEYSDTAIFWEALPEVRYGQIAAFIAMT